MSFNKFATVSLENQLFTKEKQEKFSRGCDPEDPIKNVKDLEKNAKEKLNEIRMR